MQQLRHIKGKNSSDAALIMDAMVVRTSNGSGALVEQWLNSNDTVPFLGVWEQFNNPRFIPSNSRELETRLEAAAFPFSHATASYQTCPGQAKNLSSLLIHSRLKFPVVGEMQMEANLSGSPRAKHMEAL